MVDKVSVTSHHSYGSRVKNSLKSILWGIVLIIASVILLVWNENNFIKTKKSLEEWASVVVEASATQIDSSLEWKEVHLYGETASSAEALKDEEFWVIADDLKLARTVEMYQWHESSHEECTDNLGWSEDCTTTYEYDTYRDENRIDSSHFYQQAGHWNPTTWDYTSNEWEKSPITLWAYTLDHAAFISQLTNYTDIDLSEQNVAIPDEYLWENVSETIATTEESTIDNNNNAYLYWDSESSAFEDTNKETSTLLNSWKFHINWNHIYIWDNENTPKVWDLKITFSSVKEWTVSIIWQQVWNNLTSYPTSIKWKNIALLQQWTVSAETMFANAQQANKTLTWILRFLGLFFMFLGFSAMLELIETLAKVIPFLSRIIWVGTRLIAFCFTLVLWFITIGITWLAVRPVIWISCLAVAVAGIALLANKKKWKAEDKPEIETKPEIINKPEE